MDDVFADPQVTARAMRMDMPHPVAGSVPLVANPVRFSVSRVDYRRSPPRLGEHSAEVLQEWLGITKNEAELVPGEQMPVPDRQVTRAAALDTEPSE